MSVATQITRLQTAKSDLADAITRKGVTVPSNSTLDLYAGYVDNITVTPSLMSETVTPKAQSFTVFPNSGFDGLSSVTVKGIPYKYGVIRPDATLIRTVTYDKLLVQDEGISIPAYTTTDTTLKASVDISPTVGSISLSNNCYFISERCMTIPVYNNTTSSAGKMEWSFTTTNYEIVSIPPNTMKSANGTYLTSRSNAVSGSGTTTRMIYWTSATAVGGSGTNARGIYQTPTAPTYGSGAITLKTPKFGIIGSSTYLSSTWWGRLTDIRFQYVIDVYECPNGAAIDGWILYSNLYHIIDCFNNNDGTLT